MMFTHTAQRHLYVQIRHHGSDLTLSCRGQLSSSSWQYPKRGPGCRASAAAVSEQAKEEIQQVRQPGAFPQQAVLPQQEAGDQLLTWEEVGQQAGEDVLQGYQLLPERAGGPRAAPSRVLPTDKDARTDKAVLLYRDTDGWCPFCERVWLALEEKGIPYDTMFINLRKKPDWFKDVVPTNKVPAVSINGQMVWESDAILEAIEEAFPDPPLWPSDPAKKAETQEAAAAAQQLLDAGYRYLRTSSPSSSAQNGAAQGNGATQESADGRQEFEAQLQQLEDRLARQDGPFIAGQFSIADCLYVSGLERFAANMPAFRGLHLQGNPKFPHLDAWFAAMDAKPAYQRVKSDALTLNMVYGKLFGAQRVRAQPASEAARRARREVAAKLHKNHDVVLADIVYRSGIIQHHAAVGVNGYPAEPKPSMLSAVDFTLRRLATYLLHGDPGPKPDSAESKAFGAACLAFFRNRASSPRDLSAAACDELRDACDAILRETY